MIFMNIETTVPTPIISNRIVIPIHRLSGRNLLLQNAVDRNILNLSAGRSHVSRVSWPLNACPRSAALLFLSSPFVLSFLRAQLAEKQVQRLDTV